MRPTLSQLEALRNKAQSVLPILSTHRHYKGGIYTILDLCFLEADNSLLVVYYPANSGPNGVNFARPYDEFIEKFQRLS